MNREFHWPSQVWCCCPCSYSFCNTGVCWHECTALTLMDLIGLVYCTVASDSSVVMTTAADFHIVCFEHADTNAQQPPQLFFIVSLLTQMPSIDSDLICVVFLCFAALFCQTILLSWLLQLICCFWFGKVDRAAARISIGKVDGATARILLDKVDESTAGTLIDKVDVATARISIDRANCSTAIFSFWLTKWMNPLPAFDWQSDAATARILIGGVDESTARIFFWFIESPSRMHCAQNWFCSAATYDLWKHTAEFDCCQVRSLKVRSWFDRCFCWAFCWSTAAADPAIVDTHSRDFAVAATLAGSRSLLLAQSRPTERLGLHFAFIKLKLISHSVYSG